MPLEPAPFVIIGMMSLFGGIAHAPLAVMLMVAEMTGNLSLLAPAMIAVAISTALVGDRTIYMSQLLTRADSPAHRVRLSFPLLSSLLVRDAMIPEIEPLPLMTQHPEELHLEPNQTLDVALDRLTARGLSSAPVVKENARVGVLNVKDILQTYKTMLGRSVRRADNLNPHTSMFEVRIDANSPLSGRTLRDARLPEHTIVVSITQEGKTVFPNAETQLQPGDLILILTDRNKEDALRSFLLGEKSPQTNVT
jgi:CIC family chloride channel protein